MILIFTRSGFNFKSIFSPGRVGVTFPSAVVFLKNVIYLLLALISFLFFSCYFLFFFYIERIFFRPLHVIPVVSWVVSSTTSGCSRRNCDRKWNTVRWCMPWISQSKICQTNWQVTEKEIFNRADFIFRNVTRNCRADCDNVINGIAWKSKTWGNFCRLLDFSRL